MSNLFDPVNPFVWLRLHREARDARKSALEIKRAKWKAERYTVEVIYLDKHNNICTYTEEFRGSHLDDYSDAYWYAAETTARWFAEGVVESGLKLKRRPDDTILFDRHHQIEHIPPHRILKVTRTKTVGDDGNTLHYDASTTIGQ